MQFGRTIIGAIIGAAIGIAVMIVVFLATGIDKVWLAVPVGILTGLGVRMLVSTLGHASYMRGAFTALLALGAYLFGWWIVAQVAQTRAAAAATANLRQDKPAVEQEAEPKEEADGEEATEEEKAPEAPAPAEQSRPRPPVGGVNKGPMRAAPDPLEYVWLAVAALIAYQLGRGSDAKRQPAADEGTPPADAPHGTHPDA